MRTSISMPAAPLGAVSLISVVFLAYVLGSANAALAQETTGSAPQLVTVDNFARAETDMYMATTVKDAGLGKLMHCP